MIAAKEARDLTQKTIDSVTAKELIEIEVLIKEAISRGKFVLTGDGYLSLDAINELRRLGYTVSNDTWRNEACYAISWEVK